MADSRWVSTTGDLSAAASYSPSGVPIAAGSIYFDGSSNLDANAGMTAFQVVELTRVWLQSSYLGDVGANGNPFTASVKYVVHQGQGSLFHSATTHSVPSYMVVDSPNLIDAYTLIGTDGAAGLTMTLACIRGGVKIIDGTTIVLNNLLIGSRNGGLEPRVQIGVINYTALYRQTSGFVTTKKGLGLSTSRAVIDGGLLVYDKEGTSGWNNVEVAGGRFEYNGTGTMVYCIVSSGTLDMTKDSRAKTITTLILMPGATFLTHDNITVTTLIDLRGTYPILGGSLP